MRAKPDWQPAQAGVMVYMPAPRVSVEGTQQSFSQLTVTDDVGLSIHSQQSQVSDTVLPSCELSTDVHIKTEAIEPDVYDFTRDDSPATLADIDSEEFFAEAMSTALSTPESSASADLLSQLMEAAGSLHSVIEPCTSTPLTRLDTPEPGEDYVHVGYDSDRTDFLETTPSPCCRKTEHKRRSATGKTSHHFRSKPRLITTKPVARRLDFGMKVKKRPAKVGKRSANVQALEDLRSLERAPPHNWDDDERELLCVLNRWYCGTNRAEELLAFSKTFNSITGLVLRPHIIRNQFEGHLRLYGAKAYPAYGQVFDIPFNDPEGRYTEIRVLIEEEAEALQVDLRRRRSDLNIASGTARYAKSPNTRKAYKSLVRRASHEKKQAARRPSAPDQLSAFPVMSLNRSKAVQMPMDDGWEIITDAELSPQPPDRSPEAVKAVPDRPHLVFRVWDAANRTKFVGGGFVAQTFVEWPRPYPKPIALDDASNAGKILALLHLSKQGDTPVYISTASSLLQALCYAAGMQDPQIALIDLNAASLQTEHKVHHAAEVFPWLKAQGLARWARYKGNGEYFVWSDIPSDAVLNTLNLEQLIGMLNDDEDCRQLLRFEVFKPESKTSTIAANLREKNLVLNTTNARAMGKMAKSFGLNQDDVTLAHVQDFVARVIDGWTITKADVLDVHSLSTLAVTFATALGVHDAGYTVQDLMGAFVNGVDQGTRCIAHWSRSRSGGRRQRFREA